MAQKLIHIIKATGDVVPFAIEKLRHSLHRAGAGEEAVNDITSQVKRQLHEGMTTRDIYKLAFSLLKKKHKPAASKYTLKRAIMELGPSGFPFEKYVGELLKKMGYHVKLNQLITGKCVTHEVDLIAEKEKTTCIIECKYHNSQALSCDVKIPLYVNSRYNDIKAVQEKATEYRGWVVTNTKFTTDAVKYGICAGLYLLSWDYPHNESLKELVDKHKIYPVTCLTTISKKEKQSLIALGVILCSELLSRANVLSEIMIPEIRIGNIVNEAMTLSTA
jgi:Holliday junction resolvase